MPLSPLSTTTRLVATAGLLWLSTKKHSLEKARVKYPVDPLDSTVCYGAECSLRYVVEFADSGNMHPRSFTREAAVAYIELMAEADVHCRLFIKKPNYGH